MPPAMATNWQARPLILLERIAEFVFQVRAGRTGHNGGKGASNRFGTHGLTAVHYARSVALWIMAAAIICFAQQAQAVTFQEQARRLQFIYSFLLDFRPGQAPLVPSGHLFDISAEIIPNPQVDNRVGSKNEPVNPPPLVPRFRVRYIATFGLMVGGSYNPPLEARMPLAFSVIIRIV